MKFEKTYQILSSIIMPISFFLAFLSISSAISALANPIMLIDLFIMICLVIYVVKSISFFRRNVSQNVETKIANKHLIYVNGAIALLFAVQIFFAFLIVILFPSIIKDLVQGLSNQISQQAGQSMPAEKIFSMLRIMITILFVYAVILTIHIIMSFVLVKKYRNLFSN